TFTIPGTGCVGDPLSVSVPYTIPPDDGPLRTRVAAYLPDNSCGNLSDGQTIRFSGLVNAEVGSPVYDPGERMLRAEVVFIAVEGKPSVQNTQLMRDSSTQNVLVFLTAAGSNAGSLPVSASLLFAIGNGPPAFTEMSIMAGSLGTDVSTVDFSA